MQAAYQKLHVGEIQISLRLPFRETASWQKCGGGSREAWLCRQSPSTHPPPSIAAVKRNERRIKAFSRPTWRREEKEERVDGSDVETAMSYPPVRGMNRSYPLTASHRVPPPPSLPPPLLLFHQIPPENPRCCCCCCCCRWCVSTPVDRISSLHAHIVVRQSHLLCSPTCTCHSHSLVHLLY